MLEADRTNKATVRVRARNTFVPYRTSILVVDDHNHFRDLILDLLRSAGIGKLYGAASGSEALEVLETISPNIVITDWIMPKMDGLALCAAIRSDLNEPVRSVPIVMVTGNTKPDDLQKARDAGVDEFLAKPVTVRALFERLKSAIENPRPFVTTQNYVGPCRRRRNMVGFEGPWRRNDDGVFVEDLDDPVGNVAQAAVSSAIARLGVAVAAAKRGNRGALLSVPVIVADILKVATTARDRAVGRAGVALSRYIKSLALDETPRFDVLETLADGLTILVGLDPRMVEQREDVALGLEQVLAKATRQTIAH